MPELPHSIPSFIVISELCNSHGRKTMQDFINLKDDL